MEKGNEIKTVVPALRFPEFREMEGWKNNIVSNLTSVITAPKKITSREYLSTGNYPIIDQSQNYICGWTNDERAIITEASLSQPLIIFGDHIADQPSHIFNVDVWRIARERARQFVDLINHHGGDATLIELPKLGIHGNTHAAFSDRNNLQVLDIVSDWLHSKKLDGYEKPHTGPAMIEMKPVIETIPMQD